MENRYPLFAGGRILKKEALWDLRDYAYASWQLQYADYTDGVIKGCRIRVEGSELVVGKGIMKCGDFIYLIEKEERVPYKAENRTTVLKAAFEDPKENLDHLTYEVRFFLDHEIERKQNQIELCRFHLREGSVLRDQYKSFSDMGTEYDTVNLIYATVAGREKERFHPEVLLRFAEEMQSNEEKDDADRAFCYALLSSNGEVETVLVTAYLEDKGAKLKNQYLSNKKVVEILSDILNKGSVKKSHNDRKEIIYVE